MKGTPRQSDSKKYDEASQIEFSFHSESSEVALEVKEILAKYDYSEGYEDCRCKGAEMIETRFHSEKCRQGIMEVMNMI